MVVCVSLTTCSSILPSFPVGSSLLQETRQQIWDVYVSFPDYSVYISICCVIWWDRSIFSTYSSLRSLCYWPGWFKKKAVAKSHLSERLKFWRKKPENHIIYWKKIDSWDHRASLVLKTDCYCTSYSSSDSVKIDTCIYTSYINIHRYTNPPFQHKLRPRFLSVEVYVQCVSSTPDWLYCLRTEQPVPVVIVWVHVRWFIVGRFKLLYPSVPVRRTSAASRTGSFVA